LSYASWQTRLLQSGYLRIYILVIVLFTVILAGLTIVLRGGLPEMGDWGQPRFYDVILVGIILTAALLVTRSRSRLTTIALLGSIGFSIAILFLLYSAPDLAMVQFAIETLTVILFVLVLYRLPKFSQFSSRKVRTVDVFVAISGGVLMTLMMLMVSIHGTDSRLATYYAVNSLPLANGRNIVNVILVDFRSFDTLGEITVLALAAIGVFSLVRLAVKGARKRSRSPEGERKQ
jgi:multicomponent Na+:H+ antiporter subunit A